MVVFTLKSSLWVLWVVPEDTFKDWFTCMHATSPDRTFPSNFKLHVSISSRPSAPLLPWKLKAPLRLLHTTLMKSQCVCVCMCVRYLTDEFHFFPKGMLLPRALMLPHGRMRASVWNCYQRPPPYITSVIPLTVQAAVVISTPSPG